MTLEKTERSAHLIGLDDVVRVEAGKQLEAHELAAQRASDRAAPDAAQRRACETRTQGTSGTSLANTCCNVHQHTRTSMFSYTSTVLVLVQIQTNVWVWLRELLLRRQQHTEPRVV